MMHVDVLLTRFVCGWLMHMASEPEVRQSMAMFKYVLQHTRERGYIIDITRRVLDKVIFIIEPGKKPVDYDYVYLDTDAEFKRYRRAGQVPDDTTEQFVSRLKNKSYSWQELENV